MRLPLPFRLDHVNIYLIEDGGGWAIIDSGISDKNSRDAWLTLFSGTLSRVTFTKIIGTHYHPDHIGLAGWLCERLGIPLLTSQTCYLGCTNISLDPTAFGAQLYLDWYRRHGMSDETAMLVATQGNRYLSMIAPLPPTFRRLVAGDSLKLGRRVFDVLSCDGHAPEQIMLYSAEDGILLAADQIIARISPNVSVWAVEPEGDPLGLYLRSLSWLGKNLPAKTLVLPGHQLPFFGLHTRCEEIAFHHMNRCKLIANACGESPRSVAELVPVLFKRDLDPHQLSFAFSETHAHVNYMIGTGELAWVHDEQDSRVRLV